MANYGEHAECKPPYGCSPHCPYREPSAPPCDHRDSSGNVRGRTCEKCGVYVRGDSMG